MNNKKHNLKKGDKIICLLSHRSSLKTGEEYIISSIDAYDYDYIIILDNDGYEIGYRYDRFMAVEIMRNYKLNSLIKS